MRIGQWLSLAVAPAMVGLVLAAILVLAGRDTPQVAGTVAAVAVLAAFLSASLSWRAANGIASQVERLTADRRVAFESHENATRTHETDGQDAMDLLRDAVDAMGAWVKEAQLPLHILLSSPFGELNENQEEMLAAARHATDAADAHIRQLAKLIDVERGAVAMAPQRIRLSDLLRPALAIAEARAPRGRISFHARVSQLTPRVIVDPVHAEDALCTLLAAVVGQVPPGGHVMLDADEDPSGCVRIVISHDGAAMCRSLELRLARGLLEAQRGHVRQAPGQTIIDLPCEQLGRIRS